MHCITLHCTRCIDYRKRGQWNVKLLYTKKETAEMLSVSLRFVDTLIARKELKPRRVGKRVLLEHRELERFSRADHLLKPLSSASELP